VNFLAIELFGSAESEILDEEQINFVAIGGGFFLLAQLALGERRADFVRWR